MKIQEFMKLDKNVRGEYYPKLVEELKKMNKEYEVFSTINEQTIDQDYSYHYSVKDNICTKGIESKAGSKILEGYKPPFNATVIDKLNEGFMLGKTNMDEFGFGTFSVNSAYGIPKNPFDKNRSCGGSSGGAAAAVSLIKNHVAIGESTGGSISCPASFTGVIGFTPTYGRVSRYGLIDYGNSLDKIGVLARYMDDVEYILKKISGKDAKDPTSMNQNNEEIKEETSKKIAIPKQIIENVDDKIMKEFWNSIAHMEYEIVDIPNLKYAVSSYYVLATAEASTNLARYCGIRYGVGGEDFTKPYNKFFSDVRTNSFGEEAKRRIVLGTYVRMAGYRDQYYYKALQARNTIIKDLKKIFKDFDMIASPTMPIISPRFDEISKLKPIDVYMLDFITIPPNLAGFPHVSLPMAYTPMPVGIQFVADHWKEGKLINIGKEWEMNHEYKFGDLVGGIK